MRTRIAFMRAINVAGHAKVEMHAFRDAFAAAGCRDVRSYIQTGYVIFEVREVSAAAVARRVRGTSACRQPAETGRR
jgi:uncharacterized protein (DUF1697 family)